MALKGTHNICFCGERKKKKKIMWIPPRNQELWLHHRLFKEEGDSPGRKCAQVENVTRCSIMYSVWLDTTWTQSIWVKIRKISSICRLLGKFRGQQIDDIFPMHEMSKPIFQKKIFQNKKKYFKMSSAENFTHCTFCNITVIKLH